MALDDRKLIEVCEIIARLPINELTTKLVPILLPSIENEKERIRLALILFKSSSESIDKMINTLNEHEKTKKN